MLSIKRNGSLEGDSIKKKVFAGTHSYMRSNLNVRKKKQVHPVGIPTHVQREHNPSTLTLPTRVRNITARWEGWCKRQQQIGSRDQQ